MAEPFSSLVIAIGPSCHRACPAQLVSSSFSFGLRITIARFQMSQMDESDKTLALHLFFCEVSLFTTSVICLAIVNPFLIHILLFLLQNFEINK